MKLCSVTIDLDPLRCYHEIHGLGEPAAALRHVVLSRALPRYLELFAQRKIAATFFVVGSDLDEDDHGRALLAGAALKGHELASHSYAHRYDMARQSRADIDADLERAHTVISAAAGRAVEGFRAPGYDLSSTLADALHARGYRYDSSVFPSWPYYFAKATVMGAMALVGRTSRSVLGDPRALLAPMSPYRVGASPFSRGAGPMVELPVTVSPLLRLPTIGTAILTAPEIIRRRLVASVDSLPFFNFELHGIDLIDADADGIEPALVKKQPDLRVPLAKKLRALEATLDSLSIFHEFLPLRDAVTRVAL